MKKHIFGRQFKRDANERKALFKGLMTSLVMHERIETTEQKAKAIKGSVEKLVTKAKIKGIQAEPLLLPYLSQNAVRKVIGDLAPRFKMRPGGYTRIIRKGRRFNDDATMVIIEWVEKSSKLEVQSSKFKNKEGSVAELKAELAEAKIDKKSVKKSAKPVKEKKEVKKTTAKKEGKTNKKEASK